MFKRDQIWARTLTRLERSSVLLSREQRLATVSPASAPARMSENQGEETNEVWLNRIKARWCGDAHQGDQ